MEEELIKAEAKQFLNQGNYQKGFNHLELLGPSDFCNYLFKNKEWITAGPSSKHFWKIYFPGSDLFHEIITGECAFNLLHHYFSKNNVISEELIKRLAEKHPEFLISALRVNRAFLNESHCNSLNFLEHHSNEYLRNHFLFFNVLRKNEIQYFNNLKNGIELISNSKLLDVLNHVAIWFEEKRSISNIDPYNKVITHDLNHYTETINLFLSIYLNSNKVNLKKFSLSDLPETYSIIDTLNECHNLNKEKLLHEHPVWKALDDATQYWYFVTGTLNTYCFDLNFDLFSLGGELLFKPKSISQLNDWFIENTKLQHWYSHFRILNEDIVHSAIEAGTLRVHNKKGFDVEMNIEGSIRMNIASMIAEDYCMLDSSILEIKTGQLIKILNGFNSNAYGRFVLPIDKLNATYPQNWILNIIKVIETYSEKEVNSSPLKILNEDRFNNILTKEISAEINVTALKNIKNLISIDISKFKFFNRFRPFISLTSKPFININGTYISFNGILGESNIMTNILINMLDKNNVWRKSVEKEETDKMEEGLANLFKEAGFHNIAFSKKYDDGDFDIMVHQDRRILYIELKRSKIRIHLDEIWDEYQNSLLKASHQIEKGLEYFKVNFDTLKKDLLKDLNITAGDFNDIRVDSLIVSTSFEQDHQMIRGKHKKITFFELQEILYRIIDDKMNCDLNGLINIINNNDYWRGIENISPSKNIEDVTIRIKL